MPINSGQSRVAFGLGRRGPPDCPRARLDDRPWNGILARSSILDRSSAYGGPPKLGSRCVTAGGRSSSGRGFRLSASEIWLRRLQNHYSPVLEARLSVPQSPGLAVFDMEVNDRCLPRQGHNQWC
jgi:hypothetical protein